MKRTTVSLVSASLLAAVLLTSLPSAKAQVAASGAPGIADLKTNAVAAYTAKHYGEAISLTKQAIMLTEGSERAGLEYNQACNYALSGDQGHAFAALNDAITDGWGDREHTAGDSDLTTLHGDARWTALLVRMEAIQAVEDKHWGTAAFKSPYAENLADADKVAGLSLLWAEAKFGFANFWHVPELNWDASYQSYVPQVLATKSTAAYYLVLQRFYALLEDGHSGVNEPEALRRGWVPLQTRLVDGRVLVTGRSDPQLDMQGVQAGDELLEIDGVPVKTWSAAKVMPYLAVSSPQDKQSRAFGGPWGKNYLLQGRAGTVFKLSFESPDGHRSERSFAVPAENKAVTAPFELRSLSGGVVYVALNEFGDDTDAQEWDKHWPEIEKAKAVILDLRRNGGGDDAVGAHILATLIDKPVPASLAQSPEWIATYRAWGQAEPIKKYPLDVLPPDAARHFAGKVAMLTGPGTFSAAEDAAVLFATSKRGLLVGEATGGSTGQPLLFNLPGGGTGRVCTKHDSFPDGREFVGVGVPPDVAAHVTREDLVRGTDSVIEAAVKAVQ